MNEILLGHMSHPRVTVWPGADGLTVVEMLESYLDAVAARQVPGPEELLASHPDLAEALEDFFAAAQRSCSRG